MQECDNCKSTKVKLVFKINSKRPYIWQCYDCGASVACHNGTDKPLGRMALSETRRMRIVAHETFDKIWLSGLMNRERAKRWIAEQLNITEEFHISQCSYSQLIEVVRISQDYLDNKIRDNHHLERLKEANYERRTRQIRRTAKINSVFKGRRKRKR